MTQRKFLPACIACLLVISACQSSSDQAEIKTVAIRSVYSDNQCLSKAAGIEAIRDKDALANWWQILSRQQLPAQPLPQSLAVIDFKESLVFVVFMGSRPTPGYNVTLHGERAPVEGTALTIPVVWQEPSPDAILAQLVTSPCVVMAVPAAQYKTIAVRNREGTNLLEATL